MHLKNQLMSDPTETNVLINGICCHSLLDTRSTVSSISESFYRHHLSDIPLQPLYGILNIECASGDSLPYKGCVEANISVPGISEEGLMAVFLAVPDLFYRVKVAGLLGTNILNPLLLSCQTKNGNHFV